MPDDWPEKGSTEPARAVSRLEMSIEETLPVRRWQPVILLPAGVRMTSEAVARKLQRLCRLLQRGGGSPRGAVRQTALRTGFSGT